MKKHYVDVVSYDEGKKYHYEGYDDYYITSGGGILSGYYSMSVETEEAASPDGVIIGLKIWISCFGKKEYAVSFDDYSDNSGGMAYVNENMDIIEAGSGDFKDLEHLFEEYKNEINKLVDVANGKWQLEIHKL